MKLPAKRLAALLVDIRSMIFAVTIFTLILIWMRSSEYAFVENMFLTVLLLSSSVLILINTRWSNLVAVILSGYLPVEFLRAFWMFPRLVEVRMLSAEHFRYFFAASRVGSALILLIVVTSMMLARSTSAIMRQRE